MRVTPHLAMEVLGTGPPVLLLHGAGGSVRTNFPFVDEMAKKYTVLAPDLPGVGASEVGPTPLTVPGVVERLLLTLDRAGIGRVAVCGYSMGTLLAVGLAAAAPERVDALVLTAGLACATVPCRERLEHWSRLLDGDSETLGRFVVDHIYRAKTIRFRGTDWYAAAVREVGTGFPTGTQAHIDLICHADLRDAVATTSQPMLVIVPRHDEFVTPDHSAQFRRLRPDAQTTYLAGGHALGDERPAVWFSALTGFLDQHLTPSPI